MGLQTVSLGLQQFFQDKEQLAEARENFFFFSHPFLYAARKAASGTAGEIRMQDGAFRMVPSLTCLTVPHYAEFYSSALLYRNIVLSGRMCLI